MPAVQLDKIQVQCTLTLGMELLDSYQVMAAHDISEVQCT